MNLHGTTAAPMPRLPYADGSQAPEIAERMRQRRGGRLLNLDRMLLYSPDAASAWNTFLGAVRQGLDLDPLIREMIILRVAVLNGAQYEYDAHHPPAVRAGAQQDWLEDIASWQDSERFSTEQRAVLAFTDASTRDVAVPDEVFEALRGCFEPRHVVEIVLVASTYNCVSRFLVSLGITKDGE